MYQFSRAIYRELAPQIVAPAAGRPGRRQPRAVLRACEAVVTRLATDRHYFARPERTLFCDIRNYFPMSAQSHVHQVVCRYVSYAQEYLTRTRTRATPPSAAPRRSAARRPARAPPASACRCRTTATAPPTSTSPTPRTASSRA